MLPALIKRTEMRKRIYHNRVKPGFTQKKRQKATSEVHTLGSGIHRLASTLLTAGTEERGYDGTLRHMGSLLDSVTTGIISLDGEGRIRIFHRRSGKVFRLPRVMVKRTSTTLLPIASIPSAGKPGRLATAP